MRFELVLAALGLFIPIAIFAGAVPSPAEAKPRPNIVMILSDDQDTQSYKFMPKTWALLGKRGTVFENYFVTSSLCSLSRAFILRGQCLHNTPKPIVLNIDLASTFAHMANVRPPKFVNGRSFLPLFDGPERSWRRMLRIGQLGLKSSARSEAGKSIQLEAVRIHRWAYIEYMDSQGRELCDLRRDPNQPDNIAQTANPTLVQALSLSLVELA
jgi:arylsulfatase A-like enzyme